MNTTLETLIKLQQVDAVILDIQRKIAEFPEIVQQLDKQLSESENDIAKLHVRIEEQEKLRRSKELDVDANIEKIKKYQGQLLQVKTNKEYSALLSEIKGLKSKNSLTEDDIIELMESVERARKALDDSQKELTQEKIRVHEEKQRKETEQAEFQNVLEDQQKERDKLVETVEGNLLKEYAKLFNLRNGIAVASVEDGGVCEGCHVALTPQMFAEVKTGEYLHHCPICRRFLYWPYAGSQVEDDSLASIPK